MKTILSKSSKYANTAIKVTKQQRDILSQNLLSLIIIGGISIVMLSSQNPIARRISEYSVHLMLGLFFLGLGFLVLTKVRLTFVSFACVGLMCIFLKNASNDSLKLAKENTLTNVNIAHINLGNLDYDLAEVEDVLEQEGIDMISFQELTPDWNMLVNDAMSKYPHRLSQVRIDPYGKAIYSKYPFSTTEVFDCEGKPNLQVVVDKEGQKFNIVSSYLTPALDKNSIKTASDELNYISHQIAQSEEPVIVLGEFNMVYWANEIRLFREENNLTNSRRGLSQANLRVPYDHIFFSNKLECTNFKELKNEAFAYVGIMGSYQLKAQKEFQTLNNRLSITN